MSNDLPAMPPTPEEEPPQRVPESVSDAGQAPAPAGSSGMESVDEVGARLAQLRTQRGMSLEDVSARLKVAVIKLKALEGGDLSRLKDVTFALGVVRSYAKILGADPEPMVRVLRRAYGTNEQDLSMPASSGASLPRGKMSVNWRGAQPRRSGGWLWGVGVVVVAIVLVLVFRDGREPANWLAHLKTKAPDNAAAVDNSASSAVAATAASDAPWPASGVEGGPPPDSGNPAAAADTAPAPVVVAQAPLQASVPARVTANTNSASSAKAPAALASAAMAGSAAAAPALKSAAASSTVAASAAAALPASVPAQPGVPATLTFKVTEDSWVSVRQQDGREIFSGLVHPGEGQQVEGTRPLKVTVGNVHGVEAMDIDGEEADLKQYLNSSGNVAHFTLP